MSKAFALAGIRVGWIASRDPSLIGAVAAARDYTAISVSQLDDQVAAYALSPTVKPALLERNFALAKRNLELLAGFVESYAGTVEWVRPTAGTTALLRFSKGGVPVEEDGFCRAVLGEVNVLFVPARRCFGRGEDFPGAVRVGYVCHEEVLKKALARLGGYVEKHLL